jgi:asparagine synthase (glutamine-hydrolysing)
MSGVFGVVDPKRRIEVEALIEQMGACLSHRAWYIAEHFADRARNVALGRVGIGIFNRGSQPVWNAARTIALVMAGELYAVEGDETPDPALSDEQRALALYEKRGDGFVRGLEGSFVIAIWDSGRDRLLIANDRFGLYPLYYAARDGRLIFSPEVKGILCDQTLERKLDLTALAQYVRFQHLLGARTFFEDVHLMPPASRLTYEPGTAALTLQPYWTFDDIPHRPEIRFDEAVEEAGRLLRRAVRRLSSGPYRPGVYLSGGLDSRTILGLIERRPVVSLTYGARDCRDVHYAGRIARTVGSDHHWFDFPDGNWVREYADFHLELTEGFHSWIHAHGISTLAQARQLMDVNLSGWDGGTVMAYAESADYFQMAAVDDPALLVDMFHLFNQKCTWPSITEAEERVLYCAAVWKQVNGLALDSFRAELTPYLAYRPDVRGEYFYIRNHCGRLTQNMIAVARSHVEVRFPFFDCALFDFIFSLPASQRAWRKLYQALIWRETPRLALIPYDKDEFLPTPQPLVRGLHEIAVKLSRRVNWHLWPLFAQRATLYADYENYLRHELRDWAEAILFDRRTTERGLFRLDALRSLMARHVAGRELWTIGKIAPLITYEMMLRRLYD